jgi:hypothetical protein
MYGVMLRLARFEPAFVSFLQDRNFAIVEFGRPVQAGPRSGRSSHSYPHYRPKRRDVNGNTPSASEFGGDPHELMLSRPTSSSPRPH